MNIEFQNVTKIYFKQEQKTLKELIPSLIKGSKPGEFLEALKNISFELAEGDVVGILGKNGAGKSTVLKLIAGVSMPTDGAISIHGKIAPLIELGAGFHPELTGRENIYLNSSILGLSKKEVDNKLHAIVRFAELEEFIDTPVKHYSSGMYMRLGFSVAINVPFDILLTDEILAVGDVQFQQKCLSKMSMFKKEKKIIVFVSHNLKTVKDFCTKGLVLNRGKQEYFGPVNEAITVYNKLLKMKTHA